MTRINAEEKSPQTPFRPEKGKVRAIERRTVQILLVASAFTILWRNWSFSIGLILGGVLALLNFHWLAVIGRKIFLEKKLLHVVQLMVKFFVLALAVFFILTYARVHAVGFILGTFTLVVGILWETLGQGARG